MGGNNKQQNFALQIINKYLTHERFRQYLVNKQFECFVYGAVSYSPEEIEAIVKEINQESES